MSVKVICATPRLSPQFSYVISTCSSPRICQMEAGDLMETVRLQICRATRRKITLWNRELPTASDSAVTWAPENLYYRLHCWDFVCHSSQHVLVITCVLSRTVISNSFASPWTIAHQAPLSMGLASQEHWSALPFSSPRDDYRPDLSQMNIQLKLTFIIFVKPNFFYNYQSLWDLYILPLVWVSTSSFPLILVK